MRTYFRFGRIDTIAYEEGLMNASSESGRDERRKDHRHCRIIVRSEDLFSIEITIFSVQKLTLYLESHLSWLLNTLDRF